MNGGSTDFTRLALIALLAGCAPAPPLDFDGKPMRAVLLLAFFEGGVLAVQRGNSHARAIVELTVEEPLGATMEPVSLRVGSEPSLRPTRLHLDRSDCAAKARLDTTRRRQPEAGGVPVVAVATPCVTMIRAEFRLARLPTANDSLFVITHDRRVRPAQWYRARTR